MYSGVKFTVEILSYIVYVHNSGVIRHLILDTHYIIYTWDIYMFRQFTLTEHAVWIIVCSVLFYSICQFLFQHPLDMLEYEREGDDVLKVREKTSWQSNFLTHFAYKLCLQGLFLNRNKVQQSPIIWPLQQWDHRRSKD